MDNKRFIKEMLQKKLQEIVDKEIVAGILIKCSKTNNVLLLLRNDTTPVWALVSGGVNKNEDVVAAIKREIYEELFIKPNDIEIKFSGIEHLPIKNREFHYYEGISEIEFKPILDHENLNWGWFNKNELPSPLYHGLLEKIQKI